MTVIPAPVTAAGPERRRVSDQFLELICADEELLATEFEAIIGGFSDGAGSPRPLLARAVLPPDLAAARIAGASAIRSPAPVTARTEPQQRSPPGWAPPRSSGRGSSVRGMSSR